MGNITLADPVPTEKACISLTIPALASMVEAPESPGMLGMWAVRSLGTPKSHSHNSGCSSSCSFKHDCISSQSTCQCHHMTQDQHHISHAT